MFWFCCAKAPGDGPAGVPQDSCTSVAGWVARFWGSWGGQVILPVVIQNPSILDSFRSSPAMLLGCPLLLGSWALLLCLLLLGNLVS